jgi:hypothetical protein
MNKPNTKGYKNINSVNIFENANQRKGGSFGTLKGIGNYKFHPSPKWTGLSADSL